ncbi:MAG: hypothetical protein MJA83_18615, partial [Gammaproteobacteria bacterium]|nr:hypothetical protein [Gammaproteobacteria bacterium]
MNALMPHGAQIAGLNQGFLCLLMTLAWPVLAVAQVNLSLNLEYSNPMNVGSGGNWTLVGKAPNSGGIATLSVRISNMASQEAAGPTGMVNGGDTAGFSFYAPGSDTLDIDIFQFPLANQTGGLEERFF